MIVAQSDIETTNLDFGAILSAAESDQQWPLIRDWLNNHSQVFNRFLRNHHRTYKTPDCILISHYDDVVTALGLPEIFSVQLYKPKMGSYLMTEDNTPIHNEDKAIMSALLSREDIPKTRSIVGDIAESLIKGKNAIDLVGEYSRHVPAKMVQQVFGLDGTTPEKLIGYSYWNQYSAFRNQAFNIAANSKQVERSKLFSNIRASFYMTWLLIRKYWKIKRGKPDDDTVTRLLQQSFPGHGSLSIYRKGLNAGGLLIGAIETTSEAVVHIMNELRNRPDVLEQACKLALDDKQTQSFDNLVWECLRQRPIAPYIFRKMSRPYTMEHADGTTTQFETGQTVLCLISSAMFDDKAFPNADTFDITREFGKSFHFGFGHHTCLGMAFGMVLVPEMVRQLCKKPALHTISEFNYLGKPFPESMQISWGLSGSLT